MGEEERNQLHIQLSIKLKSVFNSIELLITFTYNLLIAFEC